MPPLDPMNLYDPRHTTGISPLHGRPKHGAPIKALLILLASLLIMLAGALWLMFVVIL